MSIEEKGGMKCTAGGGHSTDKRPVAGKPKNIWGTEKKSKRLKDGDWVLAWGHPVLQGPNLTGCYKDVFVLYHQSKVM